MLLNTETTLKFATELIEDYVFELTNPVSNGKLINRE